MHVIIRRIREALAAGTPVEDVLTGLETEAGPGIEPPAAAGEDPIPIAPEADLTARIEALTAERDAARAQAGTAVDRYRTARAEALGVGPDLLPGATIEAIDTAVDRTRALIEGLEQRVRDRIAATRVPAGDTGRATPDLAALPPIEKIKAGLARQ